MLKSRQSFISLFLTFIVLVGVSLILRGLPKNLNQIIDRDSIFVPTSMTQLGENLIFAERSGVIKVYQEGRLLDEPFLNLFDKIAKIHFEQGLFSAVVSPDEQFLYVNYTAKSTNRTVIERYRIESSIKADETSAETIFTADQPELIHFGGDMAFGTDGYLYFSLGDGGRPENAQSITNVFGKLLRIDVSSLPYSIPPDNPFFNVENAASEIWVYGLRNAWRFSFDEQDNIFIGDVGEDSREEINFIPSGVSGINFGWYYHEGTIEHIAAGGITSPIAEYDHIRVGDKKHNCSVTGGYSAMGLYYFADWCSGNIWTLENNNNRWLKRLYLETDLQITSFGQDKSGTIYLLTIDQGVWRLN